MAGICRTVIQLPAGGRDVALLQRVQIDFEAYRASSAMGTAGMLPGF